MKSKSLAAGGLIAAIYIVLTLLAASLGLSSGVIQIRVSEALCVLPVFTPAAVPGLFLGCLVSNLLCGAVPADIIFGSLATLIGAVGTRMLRNKPLLAVLPPIASNTLIIPFVIAKTLGLDKALPLYFLTVAAGETVSCGFLGLLLYRVLKKREDIFR